MKFRKCEASAFCTVCLTWNNPGDIQNPMNHHSRRDFLASAAALATAAASKATFAATPAAPLRVQYTTGSHTVPIQQYAMFDDYRFRDLDTWILPHPHPFDTINGAPGRPGPDVVVLGDYVTGNWPETDRPPLLKFLESGKGLVVLHHAVGDNQDWPYWFQEVLGGGLVQTVESQKWTGHHSGLRQFPRQHITPVGDHPISRNIQPFLLPRDELFTDMWFSPKAVPLLRSDDKNLSDNGTIAWLGVHPKARVVCFQAGHTDWVNQDPTYRKIVHNMILWAAGRLA